MNPSIDSMLFLSVGSGDASLPSTPQQDEKSIVDDSDRNFIDALRVPFNSARKFTAIETSNSEHAQQLSLSQKIKKLEKELAESNVKLPPVKIVFKREDLYKLQTEIDSFKQLSPATLRKSATMSEISSATRRSVISSFEDYDKPMASKLEKQVDQLRQQILLTKMFSCMFFSFWQKKRKYSEELLGKVNQLMMQKSFLNCLREKESVKRDQVMKMNELLKRENMERSIKLEQLKQKCDLLSKNLCKYEEQQSEMELEIEKTEYMCNKLTKENIGYLDHIQKINNELIYLRSENKEQKRKIMYMNGVADQQDVNLKQLHKIAEELDAKLKANVETVCLAKKRRDEAVQNEERMLYKMKMMEQKLEEAKETEAMLRSEIQQLKDLASESEKCKIIVTLENVDLKYQLEDIERDLKQLVTEKETLREIVEKSNTPSRWNLMQGHFENVSWDTVALNTFILLVPVVIRKIGI